MLIANIEKEINGCPKYTINRYGEVFSIKFNRRKKLNTWINYTGYLEVGFSVNNRRFKKRIHRLLAEHYLSDWDNALEVNHINGIKTDNRLENLEMCTSSEKHTTCI